MMKESKIQRISKGKPTFSKKYTEKKMRNSNAQVPIAQLRSMGALEWGLCCGCGGLKGCLASATPYPKRKISILLLV
jgi:hypothetical protein